MKITNLGEDFRKSLLDIENILQKDNYDEILDYVGEGFSSNVYGYDDFAVKVFNKNKNSLKYRDEDYKYLNLLKESSFFPNLYAYKEKEFIVVDYVEGRLLSEMEELIREEYFPPEVEVGLYDKIAKQFAQLFNYCLSKKIIPYDLHDDNIMIDKNGDIFVVDVGYFMEYSTDENSPIYISPKELETEIEDSYDFLCDMELTIRLLFEQYAI